jgi:hypothetical protein
MKRSELNWASCRSLRGAKTYAEAYAVKGASDAGRNKGQRFSPIVGEILFMPTKADATFVTETFKGSVVIKVWIYTSLRGRQLLPLATLRKTPDIPDECTELFRDPKNELGDRMSLVGISDLEMLDDLYGKDIEVYEEMLGHLYAWEKVGEEWRRKKDKDGNQEYEESKFWKYKLVNEDTSSDVSDVSDVSDAA